jgi:cellulose synthase/poly-beta-1,6-N-acetylglucosamine synthase-like glycosyltransferase
VTAQGSVSIVVVTHNEGERLRQTVVGLAATAPEDSEVIVVDDLSTDGSIELLRASQPDVRVVKAPKRLGVSPARNFGARLATGSVVLWSDAHVDPQPGWSSAFAAILADPCVGAVGSAVAVLGKESAVGFGLRWKNAALEVEWLPREGDEPYPVPFVSGCFMAMRREVFEQTGGFDPGLILWGGDEMELCFRLWALGYECRLAPRTRVAHLFRSRFPYAVNPIDVLHNLLRIAIIHFDRDRLGTVIAALGSNPVFPQALALALDSDVWLRRADMRSRRVLDDQAFFDRFPMHDLNHQPRATDAPS